MRVKELWALTLSTGRIMTVIIGVVTRLGRSRIANKVRYIRE